ncbi:MAG TPA: hypothetical protein VGM23_16320 [Armatimonadota bacterium]
MRTYCLRALLLLALCSLTAGLLAQTTALPGTDTGTTTTTTTGTDTTGTTADGGTSTLPGATPPTKPPEQTTGSVDDTPATPPTNDAATLPAQAKRSSLMVKRGEKSLETRLSYSHFSNSALFIDGVSMLPVLVIGDIGVQRTRKELLIASLALQYGLRDNLEAEVRVPYRYQYERRSNPEEDPNTENTLSGGGIGDVEGALYFQLHRKSEMSTRWIASLQVKSATGRDLFSIDPDTDVPLGTGFWSTNFSLNGVKISDPAALFWNIGFSYNWLRKNIRVVSTDPQTGDPVVSYVDVKPGNTISFGGGIAYALNPNLSLNTGLSVSVNQSTTANGKDLANTALVSASLRFGMVVLTARQVPIDIGVSIGLTEDSPDFTLELRRTFKF